MTNDDFRELDGLSEKEKAYALEILKEYSLKGSSKKLDDLLYSDYREIPVDIETFLHDPQYLGKGLTNEEGKFTVFPYWVDTLKKLFPSNLDLAYNTLILTGPIGIGKTIVAVIAELYMLYRMMCLKDPYLHYGLQPIDKISFGFINITLDAAKGVAWDKCQNLIQSSPWFMAHGHLNRSTNPTWKPDEGIELIAGSRNNHIIGRCLFCLDGETEIVTAEGISKIEDLVGRDIQVISVDNMGNQVLSNVCTVAPTVMSEEEYEIELADGSVIKCTGNHRLLLSDGTYKEVKDLSEDDELAEIQYTKNSLYKEFIDNIIQTRGQWNIPPGEYMEAHHIVPKCMGGKGNARTKGKPSKHPNIIWLYANEHFIAHKLLALENPHNAKLVYAWSMMAFPKGKTKRDFEISAEDYEALKRLQSDILRNCEVPADIRRKISRSLSGRHLSDETKSKISKGNKGKVLSADTKSKISSSHRGKSHSNYKNLKGKVCITDGISIKYIDKGDNLPLGWRYGNCKTSCKHNMSNYYSNEEMRQRRKEISLGPNNNMFGKGHKVSGGNNGHAIYIYTYKNIDYQTRDDLIKELKKEFPSISESAIRKIQHNNYGKTIINKYKDVIDNLTWRLKER